MSSAQGEEVKKRGKFSCKWEDLRVRGDICRLETKCSGKQGTQCDTTYISSSFPPGAYQCACINGFVPSSKPLPGNVVLPGERCVKKSPQGLEIRHSKQNVALGMKTTVSSTDNYAGCKKKDCKEIPAFGRFVVDGRIKTCFRSLTEHNPWLMVHLDDYYPIFLVRITTSARSLHNVKVYVASENNLQLCAFYSGKLQGNRLVSFGCSQLYTYGNDVKIETTHSSILNLCEVEIYADTYVNIALNQFSESKPKSSRLANDGNLGSCFTASYWYLELGANVRVSVVFILHKRSTNLEGFDIVVGEGEKKDLCTTIPKYSHKNDQGNYFECKEAVVGKFLSLTLTRGRQRQISLCEVEVFQTKTSETFSTAGAAKNIPAWWSVDLRAICKVHLVRVVTSEKYKPADLKNLMIKVNVDAGFNKGKSVASLKNPTQEPVQTLTLPKDTKARYVTIELKKLHTSSKLDFREVEIYNGPLLDVNECDRPGVKCSGNFRCQDHLYKYTCECDGGFKLTGPSNNECTDIDECLSNPCHVDASCSNTHGSFKCTCNHGFAGDGRKVCSGLKPCLTDQDCRENQFCKEIKGSRLCDCKEGYLFKNMTCVDANECELEKNICGSNSVCTNSKGSYKCNCVGGYESKTDDGKNCFDIDECKTANCGDVATCENTEGSFHCECPEGFSFDKKERECYDIDECSVSGSCGPNQLCSNEMGTYSCPCRTGYREIKNPRRCIAQGEEKKKQGTFSCKWEDLRVRGDICRLETKCSAKHGTQCDTTYISSSFPPGAYHCACINGFVPSSKPLPGNVVLPGERCVKKSPQGLEIRHSKQNVALGMKTTVSSTDNYAGCKKKDCKEIPAFGRFVVDGRIKTCFRSLTEHNPWLMVHLNDYYPISLVRITTSARSLHNVKVYVASENNLQLCAFYSGKLQGNRLVSFGCSQLYTYGNDVKIETTHSSILNLCEVEIYADTYVNIALNQFSESKPKSSRLANDGNLGSCFTASYWYLELGANVRVSVVFILHKRSTNLEGFDIVVGEGEKKDLCTTIPKYSHKNDQGNYFECKEAVVGKFLSLTLTRGRQRQISLCEVEVFQTKTSETFSTAGAAKNIPAWWSVDLRAICKVHLVRVVTSEKYKPADLKNLMIKVNVDAGFNKGKSVASLKNPTQEPVQTLTLPKDTKARYVTIELKKLHTSSKLDFREVEIYNGPLLDVNECDRPGVKCSGNFRCQDHLYKYTCECDGGFKLTGPSNNECTDIDECLSNPCHVDASCSNTHGSFKCTCNHGFAGDGRKVCSGLKPCLTDQDCRENQFCKEIKGSRLCDCKEGYIFKNMTCVDANECELEKDICGSNSVCTNSEGSYKCNCVGGYESKTDDGKNCFDIDECKTANCGDVATCENTEGSFHCECPEGFSFDKKERECYDIDECSVSGSCGPNQLCSNEMGTYSCPCRTGYREIKNPRRCIDIDECEIDDYKCPEYSKCDNKDGGYDCPCKTGYKKTQQGACSEICVPKCEKNSYCVNGQCLCETGFFLGLDRKCQASLHGSGISPQSSAALLTAALLWCLALM
ncbi:hypothetical protein ACROYT_G023357 [Oculina patagonica]